MKDKLLFLEGLRGFAALIVVIQHFTLLFYPALFTGDASVAHYSPIIEHGLAMSPLNILFNGNFAVCMFFVLSGFVLSYKYFKTNNERILIDYSVKRYFRLMPPVLFSVICSYIIIKSACYNFEQVNAITKSGEWLTNLDYAEPTVRNALYNAFADIFMNGNNSYNVVFWTMSTEFLGSLLLFAVLFVSHYFEKKAAILWIMIGYFIATQYFYYTAFFAGALLCRYYVSEGSKKQNGWITLFLLAVAIYLCSYPVSLQSINNSVYTPLYFKKYEFYPLYHILGSVCLLLAIIQSGWLVKLFSTKLLVFLGKISFSMYLLHIYVLIALTTNLFMHFQSIMSYNRSALLAMLISLPVILIISWVVYLFVDKQAITFSGKMVGFVKTKLKFRNI